MIKVVLSVKDLCGLRGSWKHDRHKSTETQMRRKSLKVQENKFLPSYQNPLLPSRKGESFL